MKGDVSPMGVRIQAETSVTVSLGTRMALADLRAVLDQAGDWPGESTVDFSHSRADPRDPREADHTTIKITKRIAP